MLPSYLLAFFFFSPLFLFFSIYWFTCYCENNKEIKGKHKKTKPLGKKAKQWPFLIKHEATCFQVAFTIASAFSFHFYPKCVWKTLFSFFHENKFVCLLVTNYCNPGCLVVKITWHGILWTSPTCACSGKETIKPSTQMHLGLSDQKMNKLNDNVVPTLP